MNIRTPGKLVRNCVYCHRKYIQIKNYPSTGDIIKINNDTNAISVIECFDFDNEDEPQIRTVWGQNRTINYTRDTGPLYHHKWMFVADDYAGFNVEESKARSIKINAVLTAHPEIKRNKIGNKKYWEDNVIPLL